MRRRAFLGRHEPGGTADATEGTIVSDLYNDPEFMRLSGYPIRSFPKFSKYPARPGNLAGTRYWFNR